MIRTRTEKINYFRVLAMLALLVASLLIVPARPAHASATFIVTSDADFADAQIGDGLCKAAFAFQDICTLRAALQEANFTKEADTIEFAIPGTGVKTISPQTNLPSLGNPVTIDGFTQPGSSENTLSSGTNARPMIEISGSAVTGTSRRVGLTLIQPSTVKGLVIDRFDVGVAITSAGGAVLQQNFIGTDPTGTQDLGNSETGVLVTGVSPSAITSLIGGNQPKDANLISGNDGAGLTIRDPTAIGHDLIGTDSTGTNDLGNDGDGVDFTGSEHSSLVENTIAFNGGDGVKVADVVSTVHSSSNVILSNSIFSNDQLGIDLVGGFEDASGVTANEPGDVDVGPNGLQNFPVLTSARTNSDKTIISGTLNSAPNEDYELQFFSSSSGSNEGEKFIGETFVSTDGSGDASFEFSSATAVPVGRAITATATSASTLDTSEFAAPTTVKDGTPPSVTKVSPAENATGVSPKANVAAFFSEAMDPSTINAKTVTLRKVGTSRKVRATVIYDSVKQKALLNPKTSLTHGATYVVTVATGAKDEAGNALDQDVSLAGNQPKGWKFKVKK